MITSIDIEKKFDKLQHFNDKISQQIGIGGT